MREGYPINGSRAHSRDSRSMLHLLRHRESGGSNRRRIELGRGILGVIDGSSPKGVESPADAEWRHGLLRKIGYKR